ncbi:MAG: glycosyltransferase [Thermoguttaceae bacterium]
MSILLFLYFVQVWKLEEPPAKKTLPGRSVDIFISTYDESVEILRETVSSCNDIDYPHETYLLDDGNREAVKQLAEELGVHYITRPNNDFAKAGNLNNALAQTSGEFIIVLDADHVPFRHMIDRMIGYFDDPKMGFVQSPHSAYNLDNVSGDWSPKTHQYWEDVNLFHYTVQIGKNHWNAACFCGSAAMFRRAALESVGNFATETITEDLHTGMRIAAKGWKSLAISEPLIVGQAPEDIHSFNVQRARWGLGNLSVLHFDNPATMKGLTLAQRLNYLGSILNWTIGIPLVFTFLVPIFVLFTSVSPVREVTITYLILLAGYLGGFLFAMEYVSGKAASLIGIQVNLMSNFYAQMKATIRSLFRKKRSRFVVTPKSTRQSKVQTPGWKVFKAVLPQLLLIMVGIIAIFWAGLNLITGIVDYASGFIAGSAIMLFFIWIALMSVDKSLRCYRRKRSWHYPAVLPVSFRKSGDYEMEVARGVSAFFNDSEIEWMSSRQLKNGDKVELTLTSPIKILRVEVAVTEMFIIRTGLRNARGWFYRGVIQNPSNEQLTSIEEIALKYIVPDILEQNYCTGERQWLATFIQSFVPFGNYLCRCIRQIRVPFLIVMNDSHKSETIVEEYDAKSFTFVLPYHDTPTNVPMTFEMVFDEKVNCSLCPEKVERFHIGGNTLYRYYFSVSSLDEAARRQFLGFYHRAAANRWGKAIDRVQTRKSILYDSKIISGGVLATLLICCFVGAVYMYDNKDDIFLEHTARFETVPSDVEATRHRLAAILADMESSHESDLDRWLRLYDAAVRTRNPEVSAEAADKIADVYTSHNNPRKAAEWKMVAAIMYFRITNRRDDMILQLDDIRITGGEQLLTPEKRYEYYMMRARAAAEKNDAETMERFYREAIYLNPENEEVMNEWLNSLLVMKKKYDALKHAPHNEGNKWISDYEHVLEEFQAMARELPKDSDFASKSVMLSEATDRNVPEAISELEKMRHNEPLNEDDQKRLIRMLVKEKRYIEAFPMIRSLDDKIPDTLEFVRLFLWTATPSVASLSDSDKEWAKTRMAALLQNAAANDYAQWHDEDYISVIHFLTAFNMLNDSEQFLRDAIRRIPKNSLVRKDIELKLAMLLRAQKRFQEAETLLDELIDADNL